MQGFREQVKKCHGSQRLLGSLFLICLPFCSHSPKNISCPFLKRRSYATPPAVDATVIVFFKFLTHEAKWAKTRSRSHNQFLARIRQGLQGSLGLSPGLIPPALEFKVPMKSKHNYIASLTLFLTKSNRKIYCLSEASQASLGQRQKLGLTI